MFMFYHPDRRDRVFANYTYAYWILYYIIRKPEGFDEQCDIIFNIAVQAKDVETFHNTHSVDIVKWSKTY